MTKMNLSEFTDITNGYAFQSDFFDERQGKPLIRIRDVVRGTTQTYYTGLYDPKYLVQNGDYLIGMDGEFNISQWQGEEALLNQRVCKVVFDERKVCPRYVFYLLQRKLKEIELRTPSVTVKHISSSTVSNIDFELPKRSVQERIAEALRSTESILNNRRQTLRLADEFLKSAFVEMFGDPIKNPKKNRIVTVADVTTHIKDGPHVSPKYADAGYPILSTRNIRPGELVLEDLKYVTKETHSTLTRRFRPQRDDVLLTKGGTTGLAKAVDFDWPFCVWVHVAVLRPKRDIIPIYLEHALNSNYCYQQSQYFTHGIANRDLGLKRIARIKLLLPSLADQQNFNDLVQKVGKFKKELKQSEKQLQNLFNSLMQKAFRGDLFAAKKLMRGKT